MRLSVFRQLLNVTYSQKCRIHKLFSKTVLQRTDTTRMRICSRGLSFSPSLMSERSTSQEFKHYITAVEEQFNNHPVMQKVTDAMKDLDDKEERDRMLRQWQFKEALEVYKEKNRLNFRKQSDFILDALKYMEPLGVHKDLSCYKALLQVFPDGEMVATGMWQVEWKHYPRQQDTALEIMEQMEYYGVMPDVDFGLKLCDIFGDQSHPVRKFRRTSYWGLKFQNKNPFKLPYYLPDDLLNLGILALNKMAVDVENKIKVWRVKEEESEESKFIVSAQSPEQRELINAHPIENPVYVEGEFSVWLKDKAVTYFILRADSDPKLFNFDQQENEDELFEFETIFDTENPKEVVPRLSDHQQVEGTILAMCVTETGSRDSLINWIRCLQEDNPKLETIPIVFTLQKQNVSLVTGQETSDLSDFKS